MLAHRLAGMADWIEGTVVERRAWTPRLISLRIEADLAPFEAGQFVRVGLDIDGQRVGRPYSLVNAPHEPLAEIYFNIVAEGPLSPRLANLCAGERLWLHRQANGFLVLSEVPPARHLWLLATGTAIGPYLSILKTETPWQRFERIVLVHGVRTHEELTYRDLIDQLVEQRTPALRYVPVLSREALPGMLHGRIPAQILSGALESFCNVALDPHLDHVMLCGNSNMIETASQVLYARGLKKHRRRDPGQISTEKYH